MKKIVAATIMGFFIITVGLTFFVWNQYVNQPMSSSNQAVIFEITPGTNFRTVARNLQNQGVIRSSDFFVFMAKIKAADQKVKVGEYALNLNMRPNQILNTLVSGKSIERKITIAEGLNIFEIAEIFQGLGLMGRQEFLQLVTRPEFIQEVLGKETEAQKIDSLEGYLFPETYSFTKYTEAKSIISEMVKKFQTVYKEIETQAKVSGFSKTQILTLASIIEKETGAPQERPLISSVFHNRIRKGMRLQTDPTILYGKAKETGRYEINITKADLTRPTPYNTYVINGMPPGPIANPGKEALLAAVQPAESEYLFFVSQNDGTHEFSKDFSAHQKAVDAFQVNKRAREGKSWRDLKNKKENN